MADKVLQSITVPSLNKTFVNTPTSIAPTFNATQSYDVGDYVFYNRKLYRFTSAHSAGTWLETDATEVTVGSELGGTIKDVRIYPGASIVSGDIASIPIGSSSNYGILKVNRGVSASNGVLDVYTALNSQIKQGTHQYNPITPSNQHFSVFYGLAKASGDTTQSQSSNAVGTYTDEAKGSIQHMLGTDNLAPYESDITADQAYAIGELFMLHGKLHRATAAINALDVFTVGTNCEVVNASDVFARDVQVDGTSVLNNGVANVPRASSSGYGVVRTRSERGTYINNEGYLAISRAYTPECKNGSNGYMPIVPVNQHESTFYGLAKASGDTTQSSSSNAVGVYTDEAKSSIKSMLSIMESGIEATDPNMDGNVVINTTANLSDDYVKKTDYATTSNQQHGVIKVGLGLYADSTGTLTINPAGDSYVKAGETSYYPLVPSRQHMATFYGLAKAAGADMASSSNAVGTYTDEAKTAIRTMLGAVGDVQVYGTSVLNNGVANIPVASGSTYGVVKTKTTGGTNVDTVDHTLIISSASSSFVKAGANNYTPIVPLKQHEATFYGLTKAAGVDMASSNNSVGTYTDAAKDAIQQMLGVTDIIAEHESVLATVAHAVDDVFMMDGKLYKATSAIAVDDTIAVGTNCEAVKIDEVFVKKTDYATVQTAGVVKVINNYGVNMLNGVITTNPATSATIKEAGNGTYSSYHPITPIRQHESVFYGLATAAGDTTQKNSSNAVGTYTDGAKTAIRSMIGAVGDVQVNGTSVISNGVANIPVASVSTLGTVYDGGSYGFYGITVNENGRLQITKAEDGNVKQGNNSYRPIVTTIQHASTFYGLAKAAGDTTQSSSNNAVGTYTESAKSAIRSMLGMSSSIIGPYEETVSGSTPTITGQPNYRYLCGEVTSINITPPASGTIDVIFTSGSTVAVMTLPNTVKFPEWFDASTLEANTIYEIVITNGTYGGVMTWAL